MTDIHLAWRDEQIEMLKDEIGRLQEALRIAVHDHAAAVHRAEQAEDRVRVMTEEVLECLPTK